MNLRERLGNLNGQIFRAVLALRDLLPRQSIKAFGPGSERIEAILAINLDSRPNRWRRLQRELDRFTACDGKSLACLVDRLPAIDARNGRETAPTADVDPLYLMGDQLFVQPDQRLEECFGRDEPIRMTRQEVAVARSHVEAWKRIARGPHEYVLVLEDDVYFARGAARLIERGWDAALKAQNASAKPELLYFSYLDAGGTAEKVPISAELFRPVRGFWYLSGYVLSRRGAEHLLKSMPVVGPVDLWMNYRFAELNVLALSRPVLLQRPDGGSDNSYSILPYLSRSGIVDAGPEPVKIGIASAGLVFAWNAPGSTDAMGMALSMLGYRVRTFLAGQPAFELGHLLEPGQRTFDAYVDANIDDTSVAEIVRSRPHSNFIIVTSAADRGVAPGPEQAINPRALPPDRTMILPSDDLSLNRWEPLCSLLGLPIPNQAFPRGAKHSIELFRADAAGQRCDVETSITLAHDESPWVLPQSAEWHARRPAADTPTIPRPLERAACSNLPAESPAFRTLTETFPGNRAAFEPRGVDIGSDSVTLVLRRSSGLIRPLSSGAVASLDRFTYGHFEAEIRPARGDGLVTGFFLHRDLPRQEIDVEFLGSDPQRMLVNVYFNPGDDGAAISYGYRGTPCFIDLGFDSSADFHIYTIQWTPSGIRWLVDGRIVHERLNWDPTPIPHLPMRLHANLWSPRSVELAGILSEDVLPAHSTFRRISVQRICGIVDSPVLPEWSPIGMKAVLHVD
ncbi:family 16 glycosylhydrolase [Dongia soli]|uniref:Beta-glucanase n=1 Tax=Dongia soli TaxID=600628 RepID=A0ABU5EE04_9PROT|nr:family 16 glycosylhydrolase [Dongia soli]MDY0884091.1 family 16 glycosylhydrolase [Dongia soli]